MRNGLLILFGTIFLAMVAVTIAASLQSNLWQAGTELWPQLWFRATLLDAYCGFLTFYAWVFYRERNWRSRLLWFLLIMLLGNIAMSGYLLLRLRKLPRDAAGPQLLLPLK